MYFKTRAMADSSLIDESEEMDEARRRVEMMRAAGILDGDDDDDDEFEDDEDDGDWSALIQEQVRGSESLSKSQCS